MAIRNITSNNIAAHESDAIEINAVQLTSQNRKWSSGLSILFVFIATLTLWLGIFFIGGLLFNN